MRISDLVPSYQSAAQPQRTVAKDGSFGAQLDIAARRSEDHMEISASGADWQNASPMQPSPYLQLMEKYTAWKAQQPPQEFPDSFGPTEENLTYLKEHYSGDLSWEERVDALETMVQMGVVTRNQRNEALGCELRVFDGKDFNKEVKSMCTTIEKQLPGLNGNWEACFQDLPIGTFKTVDDLFSWLDGLLANENI